MYTSLDVSTNKNIWEEKTENNNILTNKIITKAGIIFACAKNEL